jgi:hypothetical protein
MTQSERYALEFAHVHFKVKVEYKHQADNDNEWKDRTDEFIGAPFYPFNDYRIKPVEVKSSK